MLAAMRLLVRALRARRARKRRDDYRARRCARQRRAPRARPRRQEEAGAVSSRAAARRGSVCLSVDQTAPQEAARWRHCIARAERNNTHRAEAVRTNGGAERHLPSPLVLPPLGVRVTCNRTDRATDGERQSTVRIVFITSPFSTEGSAHHRHSTQRSGVKKSIYIPEEGGTTDWGACGGRHGGRAQSPGRRSPPGQPGATIHMRARTTYMTLTSRLTGDYRLLSTTTATAELLPQPSISSISS